jgi:hypothetical protein
VRPLRFRKEHAQEEGESYYISMTDMMVGVLFIFIIMLSFFALQYRSTTAQLTKAKDSQTDVLLKIATALERQTVALEIDRSHHVVCIPASSLVADDNGKRCFAYSGEPVVAKTLTQANEARSNLINFIASDLTLANVQAQADSSGGVLNFPSDQLFVPNTATLSPNGHQVAERVAASLAQRLPCFGYGAPTTSGCSGAKMSVVNVASQAGFDAFTDAGRQAAALALQRGVAFHQALTTAQPVLAQLTNAPAGQPGAQALLRVSSYGQSQAGTTPQGGGQTISIQFIPAP